jgi:hypothetical protein
VVLPLVPNLHRQTFYNWAKKKAGIASERSLIKATNTMQSELNYILEQADEMQDDEVVHRAQKMSGVLLLYAKIILKKKVYDFIKTPASLSKMSFTEAMTLYKTITDEEKKERELRLKERASTRDDVLTIFRIGLATGDIDSNALATLKERAQKNMERILAEKKADAIENNSE